MRTFIFGAGASCTYSGSESGVNPPLANNFFEAYEKLAITDPNVKVGSFINYVSETRNGDFSKVFKENIEDFLSEVDSQIEGLVLNAKSSAERVSMENRVRLMELSLVYDQIVLLFAFVLNTIQNGEVSSQYSRLVQNLDLDDVLITFNWDTLLDRALHHSGKWFLGDGYGLDFKLHFKDEWKIVESSPKKSENLLLKLHGSTNWIMPYHTLNFLTGKRVVVQECDTGSTLPIACFESSSGPYKTYKNRYQGSYRPFSYYYYPPDMRVCKDDGIIGFVPSMPMIITPVKNKQYDMLDNMLSSVWKEAEKSIQLTDELLIIGYSFPPTDTRAWQLLKSACEQRVKKLDIVVINPHGKNLAKKLQEFLGEISVVEGRDQTFDDYLTTIV